MKMTWSLVMAAAIAGALGWSVILEPRASEESLSTDARMGADESSGAESGQVSGGALLESVEPLSISTAGDRVRVDGSGVDSSGRSELSPAAEHALGVGRDEKRSKQPTAEEMADFRSYLETTRSELRTEEAQERRRSIERKTLDIERALPGFVKRFELNEEHARTLLGILRRAQDREAEYVLLWERGADEEQIDGLRQRDRRIRDRELGEILTQSQIAQLPGR